MYRVYTFFTLVLGFALVACQLQPTPTPPRPTLTPDASPTFPSISLLPTATVTPESTPQTMPTTINEANTLLAVYPPPLAELQTMPHGIVATFSEPLATDITAPLLTINPPVSGTLAIIDNQLFYTFTHFLVYEEAYKVTISSNLKTAAGQPALPYPKVWVFTTPNFYAEASFGQVQGWQVLTAAGPRHIEFVTDRPQVAEVQFKAYHYPIEQFVAHTPFSDSLSKYPVYSELYFFANTPHQVYQYFPTAGLPLAHQWSISTTTTYTQPYQYEVWNEGIQVIEPFTGFPQQTSLPAALPAGVYVLEMSTSGLSTPPAQLLLFITNYKVIAKQGLTHLWLWASDSSDQPAPVLPVQLYNEWGVSLAQGVTDEQGMLEIPIPLTSDNPAYAVVGRGEDVVIVPLELHDERRTAQDDPQSYFVRLLVKLDFNRFQYQPGEAIYYQAWVRAQVNGEIQLPPAGLTMTLTDQLDTPRLLNEFGTVTGQVAPTITFAAGQEMMVLGSDGYKNGYGLTFIYLQPPAQPYTLTVTPNPLRPVVGQTVSLLFNAWDAAAQPLPQTKVKACLSPTPPDNLWDMIFEGTLSDPLAEKICYEGITSAAGQWELELPVEANETNFRDEFIHPQLTFSRWLVEASLQLTPTTPITIYSGFSAYNSAEWLSLEPPITVVPTQQPFTPSLTLLNLENEPVPGRILQTRLWQFAGEGTASKLVFEQESVTNSQGQLVMPLTITTAGHYTLTVTGEDSWGNLFTAEQIIFSPGTAAVDTPTFAPLEMRAINNPYQIGDVVQLFVETAYSGPAVLTLEREQVERAILVELTAPFTILELPLEPADFPYVRVMLTHWAFQDTTLRPPNYYSLNSFYPVSTSFYLTVIDPQKLLTFTLTPDKPTYAPGELATITIQVTDQQGQPAAAEVSLNLTDELSYVLYPQFKRSLYNTFYGGGYPLVRTTHTHLFKWLLVTDGSLCCHPYSPDERYGYPAYFEDNEIWLPNLRTDENGQITVQVTMPNSTGNWRLTGRAITKTTQVGETTVAISTWP